MVTTSRDSDTDPNEASLLALDNIELELPIAGLGSRALALAIDYLVLFIVQITVLVGTMIVIAFLGGWDSDRPVWWIALLIVLSFMLDWGYFSLLEWRLNGRTPGKMVVALRVVDRRGGAVRLSALLARNLVRIVDLFIGAPLIAFDPLSRRLGDRFGGTLVLHDAVEPTTAMIGRVPDAWGPREIEVVEAFFVRAGEMDPAQRDYLARKLVRLLEATSPELVVRPSGGDDPLEILRRSLEVEST